MSVWRRPGWNSEKGTCLPRPWYCQHLEELKCKVRKQPLASVPCPESSTVQRLGLTSLFSQSAVKYFNKTRFKCNWKLTSVNIKEVVESIKKWNYIERKVHTYGISSSTSPSWTNIKIDLKFWAKMLHLESTNPKKVQTINQYSVSPSKNLFTEASYTRNVTVTLGALL